MPANQTATMPLESEAIEPGMEYVPYSDSAMPIDGGCADCGPDWSCNSCGPPLLRPWATWNAGFAFTFLQPRYSDNLAATVSDATDTSATVSETSFDYDLEVSPRVWLQWGMGDSFGWRAQWWQLDQSANQAVLNAPESGLGNVAPVTFPDIDISVSAPGESLRADSQLKMYAVDLEGMRWVDFGCWSLMTAGGFRFASIDNDYRAEATNAAGAVSGSVRHSRSLDGFGPTFLIEARRPVTYRMTMFSNVRASLLFGESDTTTAAGEDLDLASAFTTERTTHTDDLLPILETQWGIDWRRPVTRCHDFYLSAAVEGQWWSGVGTASNGDADLGLFGFVLGLGLEY
jgi:hypothetical protein